MVTTRSGREVKSVLAAPPKRAARAKRPREDGPDTKPPAKKTKAAPATAKKAAKPKPEQKSSGPRAKPKPVTSKSVKASGPAKAIQSPPQDPFVEYPIPATPYNASLQTGLAAPPQPTTPDQDAIATAVAMEGFPVSQARLFKSPTPEDPFLEYPVWPSTPVAPVQTVPAPTLLPPTAIKSALRSPLKLGQKTPKKSVAFNITPEKDFSFNDLDLSTLRDGPLNGTIWYVDVHSGKQDQSFIYATLLEELGAYVVQMWQISTVPPTHILFQDGNPVLLLRASKTDGNTKVVNCDYAKDCEKQGVRLDETDYLVPLDIPVKEPTPPVEEESPESSPVSYKPRKPLAAPTFLLTTPAKRPAPFKAPPASMQHLRCATPQPLSVQHPKSAISKFALSQTRRIPPFALSAASTPRLQHATPQQLSARRPEPAISKFAFTPARRPSPSKLPPASVQSLRHATPKPIATEAPESAVSKFAFTPARTPSKLFSLSETPSAKFAFTPARTPSKFFSLAEETSMELDDLQASAQVSTTLPIDPTTPEQNKENAAPEEASQDEDLPFWHPSKLAQRSCPPPKRQFSLFDQTPKRTDLFGTPATTLKRKALFDTPATTLKRKDPFGPPATGLKRSALFGPDGPAPKRFRPDESRNFL